MLVKVTKKMTATLNKAEKDKQMRFEYCELPVQAYERTVTYDVFRSYDWGDFDDAKSVFRFIKVNYPAECYALPKYLTTYDLHKMFRSGMTVDDFTSEVISCVAV